VKSKFNMVKIVTKLTIGASLASIVLLFWSCSKKDTGSGNLSLSESTYKGVYTALADDIIRPSFATLNGDVATLEERATAFSNHASDTTLSELKSAFDAAYISLQYVMPYEFGPSESNFTLAAFNVFPTSVTKITNAVTTGTYDLAAGDMVNAIGFPAIDYLLYHADASATIQYFNDNAFAKKYLTDLVTQIKNRVSTINNEWASSTGGYREIFINNLGNSNSSSLSLWVNNFNKAFESIKRDKYSVPSGNESLNGTKFPQNVEAYYSGHSLALSKAALHAVKMTLKGEKKDGTATKGLITLLDALDARNGNDLLSLVATQSLDKATTKVNALNETLAQSIETENDKVIAVVVDLQTCVRYFKGDIPSALSVQISYQDGDGD